MVATATRTTHEKTSRMSSNLIGVWKTDPDDAVTQRTYGDVTMEFRRNGELIYTITEGNKSREIFMTYEVRGNYLVTDQPSQPQKEITAFSQTDDTLELNFDGIISRYIKVL
jgi:hypothetical protein